MAQAAAVDAQRHLDEARTAFDQAQREASENPSSSGQHRLDHAKTNLRAAEEAQRLTQAREQRHALKHAVHLAQEEVKRSEGSAEHARALQHRELAISRA